MSGASRVKGWCPGAHRPMLTGDGLITRVRPFHARLDRTQALGLCEVARAHGSGVIDLTNRGNLQIRGIEASAHAAVLEALQALGLLDDSPEIEARRNILVTPFWAQDDLSDRITWALRAALQRFPDLPAKFGFAVDAGDVALLQDAPADIRFERGADGLMIRADGAAKGLLVKQDEAVEAAIELARWFVDHRADSERRLAPTVARVGLPVAWTTVAKPPAGRRPTPGPHALGTMVGAAFGQIEAEALVRVLETTGAPALRVTPWRMILVEGVAAVADPGFLASPASPLLNAQACPGAPFCPAATVETRSLARAIASHTSARLHVSGCAKSCATTQAADVTLVGRDGRFDLVRQGCAWDAPEATGLTPDEILTHLKTPA